MPSVDIDIEVVVLDSQSDDGSWEDLVAEFGADPRVVLRQNARGLGPTRSWLDGAAHVSGDFVTFVWSDDYLFERYLPSVLPPLLSTDAQLCLSNGVVRDMSDDSEPPPVGVEPWPGAGMPSTEVLNLSWLDAVAVFADIVGGRGWLAPASPLVGLFRRRAFDAWVARVEDFSRRSALADRLLWQQAIGPDSYLYLVALELTSTSTPVAVVPAPVAQFSSHPDSITMNALATQPWRLEVGYWLTRVAWLSGITVPLPPQLVAAAVQRLGSLGVQYAAQALNIEDPVLSPDQSAKDIEAAITRLAKWGEGQILGQRSAGHPQ